MRINDLHIGIQEVMKRHDVSVHALASRAGYADSTVYEYTGGGKDGKYHMWPVLLTALFELTGDPECLLVGSRNCIVIELPDVSSGNASFKSMSEQAEKFAAMLKDMSDIYEDGVVDKNDKAAIEAFNKHANSLISKIEECKYVFSEALK